MLASIFSLNVIQTALELGCIYGLVALALFLSYSILNIADLSTDGCFTLGCAVACQIHNELPEDVRFRKVDLYEVKDKEGRVRDVWLTHSCMHCTNPSCMAVCPANAFKQRPDGIVVLDRKRCTGCGLCKNACPYDAIVISRIDGKAAKCNLCVELLDAGLNPACVDGCPVKCLTAGNVTQVLAQKKSASKTGIGYRDGVNAPNMIIIRERR